MTQSWIEAEFHDRWTLSAEELTLLPGMTDKGRLGIAIQLKFMQLHGRFPERPEEIDPAAVHWKTTAMPMRYGEEVQAGLGGMARTAKAQGRAR